MRSWLVVTLVLAGGCGRWGFTDAADGQPGGDGKLAIDASNVTTVSFGERTGATYAGVTTDTTLRQSQPTGNYGADDSVSASATSTGLVRFDTSALPPGTQIVSVALDVFTEDMALASGSAEVYVVNEAWTEGTSMGTAGAANWTMRTAAQAWSGAGASPPSRSATALASVVPEMVQSELEFSLGAPGVAAVQAWVDTPANNFGLALSVTGSGTWSINARETVSATRRPLLVVSYR